MAGQPVLDSAGNVKMKTLEEALILLQRVHGLVEAFAVAVKNHQPTAAYTMNIRRTLPSLAANLKNQFGMISDQITNLVLTSSRGASDAVRLRTLREGVAQIKQALEIAVAQTKTKHEVERK